MLMNGKAANYLIIAGEVFTNNKTFPRYYKFGLTTTNAHVAMYFFGFDDEKKEAVFKQAQYPRYYVEITDPKKVLVTQTLTVDGEAYACVFENRCYSPESTGVQLNKEPTWIKVSEAGGMTPL